MIIKTNLYPLRRLWVIAITSLVIFFESLVQSKSNVWELWCDFDRASSLICGNKMPTRCNRGFYCRSYCLLNMFRTPLPPSSGAQEYYTVVAACGISCCAFQVVGLVWSFLLQTLLLAQHVSGTTVPIIRSSRVLYSGCCLWYFVLCFSSCWSGVELRVMYPVWRMLQHPANRTHNPQHHTRPATWKPQHEIPQAATTV